MKRWAIVALIWASVSGAALDAQRGRGGPAGTAQTPRQAAPIDLTGYWVSPISEDWKFRMVTPNKGVFDGVPVNAEGRRVGQSWDPARDESAGEQCRAYGAAAIMRLPGRLHITWQDDTTLRDLVIHQTFGRVNDFYSPASAETCGRLPWEESSNETMT